MLNFEKDLVIGLLQRKDGYPRIRRVIEFRAYLIST
jgi:hypothetical protein